jgi:putative flippase GtrA
MSSSRVDTAQVRRYLGGGVLNTVVGFATILGLTAMGVSPLLANSGGYAVGLLFGFAINRHYVFGPSPSYSPARDLRRYAIAFGACFLGNLGVLKLALAAGLTPFPAQLLAAASYTVAMYVACRVFVFR